MNVKKRIIPIFVVLLMLFSMFPMTAQTAYAEGDYPDVENVSIDITGLMTWDAVPGAEYYWVGIDAGYITTDNGETSFQLKDRIDFLVELGEVSNSGTHTINIRAEDASMNPLATWSGTYTYTSPYDPIVVGTISNASISAEGILTWDEYPGTSTYWVTIDSPAVPAVSGLNLMNTIDAWVADGSLTEKDSYLIQIDAANERGLTIATWSTTYNYTPGTDPATLIQNAVISSDGVLTWDPFPGATEYWVHVNGSSRPAEPTGYQVNDRIDDMIAYEGLPKADTYDVRIEAYNGEHILIAHWDTVYAYNSPAVPIEIGTIQNVKNTNGVLTWNAYPGTDKYWVGVDGGWRTSDGTSYSLNAFLNEMFLAGLAPDSGTHTYAIEAKDSKGNVIAKWDGGVYDYTVSIPLSETEICDVYDVWYTGSPVSYTPVVRYLGYYDAVEGTDYTWKYVDSNGNTISAPTNAGTYYVIVTAKSGSYYTGSKKVAFRILPEPVSPTVTLSVSSYTYSGKVIKPAVTVKIGSEKVPASGYTVTYSSGLKNVGNYSVTVKLKGNYSGSSTVYFPINPKGTKLTKVSKAKKAATVKWKKQTAKMSKSRITGYQIQLATNSSFTEGVKTVKVKGYKKASKKIKGLTGGVKYYVRIRTYMTVSGRTYYSGWSAVKTVTPKK